jgi:hypothetical protein
MGRKSLGLAAGLVAMSLFGHAQPSALPRKAPAAATATERATVTSASSPGGKLFVVPQVQPLPNRAAAPRINRALAAAFAENMETAPAPLTAAGALKQAAAEYKANDQQGFTGASYEVLYNAHNLLSVALHNEFMGAYPSTNTVHLTFDLRTGQRLAVRQLVADTLALRRRWQLAIGRRVAAHVRALSPDDPDLDAEMRAEVRERLGVDKTGRPTALEPNEPRFNDFALTATGLTLYHNFDFPHVIQGLAPDPDYLFSYAELKNWLKPAGPLGFRR